MKINLRRSILLFVFIAQLVCCCSCGGNSVPTAEHIQDFFSNHEKDLCIIADYMKSSPYEKIYIIDSSGMMQADLEWIEIADGEIVNTISRLLDSRKCIQITKSGNTISFLLWRSSQDLGCGVAYAINATDALDIQFITVESPLSKGGWFYYLSDYNAWRTQNSSTKYN